MKKRIVESIHNNSLPFVLYVAGGGSEAISELLRFGGGSRSFIKGSALWDRKAFATTVEVNPDLYESMGFVCPKTSVFMAMSAYKEARKCRPDEDVMGIGVTCSLTYENERVGRQHRVYVTKFEKDRAFTAGFIFRPSSQDRFLWPSEREYQESTVSDFVLSMIAAELPEEIEHFKHHADLTTLEIHDTHDGYAIFPLALGDTVERHWLPTKLEEVKLIFPGSFNPPHEGHFTIAQRAEELTGEKCYFEISIENVYKAPITVHEIIDRLDQFSDLGLLGKVILTRFPTYIEKFTRLSRSDKMIIVAGYDAYKHFVESLSEIETSNAYWNQVIGNNVDCRFLAFNRRVAGQDYDPKTLLSGLDSRVSSNVVSALREKTDFVNSTDFSMEISSSAIRSEKNA